MARITHQHIEYLYPTLDRAAPKERESPAEGSEASVACGAKNAKNGARKEKNQPFRAKNPEIGAGEPSQESF